jgi:uncharacterized damage-inducible protein DinB
MSQPEVWLRGPIEGIPLRLQPVAHSLMQSREELEYLLLHLTPEHLWRTDGTAASIGYHILHAMGALDRLFTYARGATLSDAQRQMLAEESLRDPGLTVDDLRTRVEAGVRQALDQLRDTKEDTLLEARSVGRARLPSTVMGLLFHAAEHTQRHAGQALTTSKLAKDPR